MITVPDEPALRARTGRKWRTWPGDVIPAWIADMDLMLAPAITETLADAVRLGDFGYAMAGDAGGIPEAFSCWTERRWNWHVDPGDVMVMPDVVGGIANCIEALTEPGDAILVQTPAYPPLLNSVRIAGRQLIEHPLIDGLIDFADLERVVGERRVRMILFCHPHNPSGRSFRRAELEALAAIARRHGLIIVSDEVHADLTYPGHDHIPFATIAPEITVTLNAPSKAFNLAGLRTAVCIPARAFRPRLKALPPTRWNAFSTLGVRAALAAWSDAGEAWLTDCVAHLKDRRDQLENALKRDCPIIGFIPPEAGYLAWLDCRALGVDDPARFFLDHAKVALSPGPDFGAPGRGFARLNFATSDVILDEIVARLARSLSAAPHIGA
jgi:cystathionine beta-lyase